MIEEEDVSVTETCEEEDLLISYLVFILYNDLFSIL